MSILLRVLLPIMILVINSVEMHLFPLLVYKTRWVPATVIMEKTFPNAIETVASTVIKDNLAFVAMQSKYNATNTIFIDMYNENKHLFVRCEVMNVTYSINVLSFESFNDSRAILSWTADNDTSVFAQIINTKSCTHVFAKPLKVFHSTLSSQRELSKYMVVPYRTSFDVFWQPCLTATNEECICKQKYTDNGVANGNVNFIPLTAPALTIAPTRPFDNSSDFYHASIKANRILDLAIVDNNGVTMESRQQHLKSNVIKFDLVSLGNGCAICALGQVNNKHYVECINYDEKLNVRGKSVVPMGNFTNGAISIKKYSDDELIVLESHHQRNNTIISIHLLLYSGKYSHSMVFDKYTCDMPSNINVQYMGLTNYCISYGCIKNETTALPLVFTKCITSDAGKTTAGILIFVTLFMLFLSHPGRNSDIF